jgi:hypothetical protein
MAESTLALNYADLQSEVGFYLGFGRGSSAPYNDTTFSTTQQQTVDACIKSGLRSFYYPDALEGQDAAYTWSFMKPVATLTLGNGQVTIPLPDDFGGIENRMSVNQQGQPGNMFWPVEIVGVGQVYQAQTNLPTTTGRPQMACVEPLKLKDGILSGQRFQLRFFPIADAAYNCIFAYYVNPDYLTNPWPWPYGGMMHAETIRLACLAAAEAYVDDRMQVNAQRFQDRLRASITADMKTKPQTLGYNGDRSDALHTLWGTPGWPYWHYNDQIMVNGVVHGLAIAVGLVMALMA